MHPLMRKRVPLLSMGRGCVAAWHAGHLPYPSLSGAKLNDFIQNKHHAQLGSTSGSDSNDPLSLGTGAVPYIYFPGVNGNYLSSQSADRASVRVTGDITVIAGIQPSGSWATNIDVANIWAVGSNNRSWRFTINTAPALRFDVSSNGLVGTEQDNSSTAGVSFTSGQFGYVKVTRNSTTGDINFYQSSDYDPDAGTGTWTKIGNTVASTPSAMFAAATDLQIGATSSGTVGVWSGAVRRVQVFRSIDGTSKIVDLVPTNGRNYNATGTQVTESSQGLVFTINRSTSGRKTVVADRPLYAFGTDDYDEVPDNADLNFGLSDSFTVAVAMRQYATPVSNGRYLAKQNGSAATAAGYSLNSNGTNLAPSATAGDGTTGLTATGPTFTAGAVNVIGMRRRAGVDLVAFTNGALGTPVVDTLAATLSNANVLRFGSRSDSAATFQDFEWLATAIFKRGLTDSEIRELNRLLIGVPV